MLALAVLSMFQVSSEPWHLRLSKLLCRPTEVNEVVSPVSADVLLEMLRLGAVGQTRASLGEIYRRRDDFAATFSTLTQVHLPSAMEKNYAARVQAGEVRPFQVRMPVSIWSLARWPATKHYASSLRESLRGSHYLAPNFGAGQVSRIDAWIGEATNGLIRKAVSELPTETEQLLATAMYMYAPWQEPFPDRRTYRGNFTRGDGTTIKVTMMDSIGAPLTGSSSEGYSAVMLPYRVPEYSLLLVLPPREVEAGRAFREMTGERFAALLERHPVKLHLMLPKVSVSSTRDLSQLLDALGVSVLCAKGDFSTLNPRYASGFTCPFSLQCASIRWDEKGTEGAATSLMAMTIGVPSFNDELAFDRPFLFYVLHERTDSILMAGFIGDPSATAS